MARKTGTSMSYAVGSPRQRRRQAAKRRAEEQAWVARSGPVFVYHELGQAAGEKKHYPEGGAAGLLSETTSRST